MPITLDPSSLADCASKGSPFDCPWRTSSAASPVWMSVQGKSRSGRRREPWRDSGGRALTSSASRSCDLAAIAPMQVHTERCEARGRSTMRFVMTKSFISRLQQCATGIRRKSHSWTVWCRIVLTSIWIFAAPWVAVITARA